MFSNLKLYASLAALTALLAGYGFSLEKAYQYGVQKTEAAYEIQLAKIKAEQVAEATRQVQANQAAQDDLNAQITKLQTDNASLSQQLAANAKAAAVDPHAHTVAVSAAGVQRIRRIRQSGK